MTEYYDHHRGFLNASALNDLRETNPDCFEATLHEIAEINYGIVLAYLNTLIPQLTKQYLADFARTHQQLQAETTKKASSLAFVTPWYQPDDL